MSTVLIVGRPNVGKSTFINRLVGRRRAITFDEPGVTRDILSYPCKWGDHSFTVMDSGGILLTKSSDIPFQAALEDLVKNAVERVDLILFMTSITEGVDPYDQSIAHALRPYRNKTLLVVNKVENSNQESEAHQFYQLGMGDPFLISAAHKKGVDQLMSALCKQLPVAKVSDSDNSKINLAIVGRPNVGKSSFINALLNESRVLVSEVAGTTRDSVDIEFVYHSHDLMLIDTAGLRRKSRVKDSVEFFSTRRTLEAINRADVVLILLDPTDFLRDQDKKIVNLVQEAGKPFLFYVNKWDLTEKTDRARRDLITILHDELPFSINHPILIGSAKDRRNIVTVLDDVIKVSQTSKERISTPALNKVLKSIFERTPPQSRKGKFIRLFYGTQVECTPPTFVLFVNHPTLVDSDYKRFLEKQIRRQCHQFYGNPIHFLFKGRRSNMFSDSSDL